MKDQVSYTQCKLEKAEGTGVLTQTCWIPSNLAKINRHLEIKKGDDWQDGWVVKEKYSSQSFRELDTVQRGAIECFRDKLGY